MGQCDQAHVSFTEFAKVELMPQWMIDCDTVIRSTP